MDSLERPGVVAGEVFYAHTPHFLRRRQRKHIEATDERIIYILEFPEVTVPLEGDRQVYWGRIQEPGIEPWWMKVVVVKNATGLAILSAYGPDRVE